MTTAYSYSPEIERFIRQELATGDFADEAQLVSHALGVYCELKERHQELRQRIEESLNEAARGEVSPLDMDEIIAELEAELDEDGRPR